MRAAVVIAVVVSLAVAALAVQMHTRLVDLEEVVGRMSRADSGLRALEDRIDRLEDHQ